MKKCTQCNQEKDLSYFYNSKHTKDGFTHKCKECLTTYRQSNKERARLYMQNRREIDSEALNAAKRIWYQGTNPIKKILVQSKSRAKTRGIEYNITETDITIPTICPYLKVPFIAGTKDNYEYTHSIDRKDNSKGYVPGNVEIITKKANSMKNSASEAELINFALEVIRRNKDKDIVRTMLKNIEVE
jgi:hypothetical protein